MPVSSTLEVDAKPSEYLHVDRTVDQGWYGHVNNLQWVLGSAELIFKLRTSDVFFGVVPQAWVFGFTDEFHLPCWLLIPWSC